MNKNVIRSLIAVVVVLGVQTLGLSASKPSAVRSISSGHTKKVVIKVTPNDSVSAYALEERAPKGCQISQIDNKGTLDKSSNTIKWGVFFDKNPRTLSYKLSCSGEEAQPMELAGLVSFNGNSGEISGDKSLK